MNDREMLIFSFLRGVLVEDFGCDAGAVTMTADFRGALDLDSVDKVSLVIIVEDKFDIIITDSEALRAVAVGDLVRLASGRLSR